MSYFSNQIFSFHHLHHVHSITTCFFFMWRFWHRSLQVPWMDRENVAISTLYLWLLTLYAPYQSLVYSCPPLHWWNKLFFITFIAWLVFKGYNIPTECSKIEGWRHGRSWWYQWNSWGEIHHFPTATTVLLLWNQRACKVTCF